MIDNDFKRTDWKKSKSIVHSKAKFKTVIGSTFKEEILTCSFPIIGQISEKTSIIVGTAFFIKYYNIDLVITAYHCLFDENTGEALEVGLGFQGNKNAELRYMLLKSVLHDKFDIIKSKEFDFAIIPMRISDDLRELIIHECITNEDQFVGILKPYLTKGKSFGFGLSKSAISNKIDVEEAKKLNFSDEVIKFFENRGCPIWLPYASQTTYIGYVKNKKKLVLNTEAISGFSGGPVFVTHKDQLKLIGITTHSFYPNIEFFEEYEENRFVSSGSGLITHIDTLFEEIGKNKHFDILKNRRELTVDDLLPIKVHYLSEDEFVLHNDSEILEDYAKRHKSK